MKFTDWYFDFRLSVVDTQWHETKTLVSYAMPRVPDKRWWFDFYCMMGAYFMCCKGLFRTDEQINNGLEYAVFPNLYQVADSYVATLLTKSLQRTAFAVMISRVELQNNGRKLGYDQVAEIREWAQSYASKSITKGGVNMRW